MSNIVSERYKIVTEAAYQVVRGLTEMVRKLEMQDRQIEDLLPAIGDGIMHLMDDGDVYHRIIREMIKRDPEFFGRMIEQCREDIAKRVIEVVLGGDPVE